jgi:prepilin-type N-terminal cleavage/methylation domain-containing protein
MFFRIRRFRGGGGFTIVEMLTTLAVIGILIALLIPALNMVRGAAVTARQRAQFHSIEIALEAFRTDFGDYPPSAANLNELPINYCGAQVLAEAVVGRDLYGFNPLSEFYADGRDGTEPLYWDEMKDDNWTQAQIDANLKTRKGLYLELEVANPVKLNDIFDDTAPFDGDTYILADKFEKVIHKSTRKRTGMPILYYKADTTKFLHDDALYDMDENNNQNIYNFAHNEFLIALAPPFEVTDNEHDMKDAGIFYDATKNPNFTDPVRPYRAESFILISAGPDGEYGTGDDVFNFEKAK